MESFEEPFRYMVSLLLLAGLFFGTLALIMKRGTIFDAMKRGRREFTTNLALTFVNLVILAPFLALPSGAVRDFIGMAENFAGFWNDVPGWLTVIIAFVAFDFVIYWRHRFEHSPLLWRIHATHHADTALSWLSVQRKHPLSKLLSVCVDLSLLLLMGIPEWAIGTAGLGITFWGFLVHCDVDWTFGPLRHWLISPAAHRLHHIRDERLMGTNFGNTLTAWDRMFGTFCDPTPYVGCETGIEEGTRGIAGELARPFEKRYWRRKSVAREDESEAVA